MVRFKTFSIQDGIILGIFILALLLQLYAFVASYTICQVQGQGYSDAAWYYYAGKDLLKYHTLVYDRTGEIFNGLLPALPTEKLSPGYPCIAALFFYLFPVEETAVRALALLNIVAFMGTLYYTSCLLKIAVRKFWLRAAVLLLVAVYPGFSYSNSLLMTEYIFQFLLAAGVYYFWLSLESAGLKYVVLAAVSFSLSIHIRGVLLPLLVVLPVLYHFRDHNRWVRKSLVFFSVWLLCMMPWWLYTTAVFGKLLFLPAAGDDTVVYGLSPYFIELFKPDGASLQMMMNHLTKAPLSCFYQILVENFSVEPGVFIRWRLFGMTQNTFSYVWSEFPRHSEGLLQYFRWIHYWVVLPTLVLIPVFYRKFCFMQKLLAALPLYFFAAYIVFCPLPRYIWPALPFVFVLFAMMAEQGLAMGKNLCWSIGDKVLSKTDWLYRSVYAAFVGLLLYSVLVFPSQMSKDISDYHTAKAMQGKLPVELTQQEPVVTEELFYSAGRLRVVDAHENEGWFVNDAGRIGTVHVNNIKKAGSTSVISRITIRMETDSLFDRVGIQFTPEDGPRVDEYVLPINVFQAEQILYVNLDVHNFVIIPVYFDGNRFRVSSVRIEKYITGQ